jgi:hypothetical protein
MIMITQTNDIQPNSDNTGNNWKHAEIYKIFNKQKYWEEFPKRSMAMLIALAFSWKEILHYLLHLWNDGEW